MYKNWHMPILRECVLTSREAGDVEDTDGEVRPDEKEYEYDSGSSDYSACRIRNFSYRKIKCESGRKQENTNDRKIARLPVEALAVHSGTYSKLQGKWYQQYEPRSKRDTDDAFALHILDNREGLQKVAACFTNEPMQMHALNFLSLTV
jgi:hypothetical protein